MEERKALPIGINIVVCSPDLRLRNTLIRAIQETSGGPETGIKPAMKSDTQMVRRAHYAPAESQIILNTASPEMSELFGGHHPVAVAIIVPDRVAAAEKAKTIFEEAGYEAKVHTNAEPAFPDGLIVFVIVPALKGIILMFWPDRATIPPEVAANLPQRKLWTQEDLEGE